jgi:2-(1,2-epoxy-1,2-dihydrophenyl)acetyl-CoA isomerase
MTDILVDRTDGLVTVTLNRPEVRNAVTNRMWLDLARIFKEIARSRADRVLVLTGSGGAFCSGADVSAARGEGHPLHHMRDVGDAAMALHRLEKPSIAKVDGVAVGAGLNLALGCDLVVATERSRFSALFVKRGLSVDFGGSWLLPRIVGLHKAKELVLLAGMLSAGEALDIGLVNRVVGDDQLDSAVEEWAAALLTGPPLALSLSKTLLNKSFESSLDQALEAEAQAQAVNITSSDAREALSAFREKRTPNFTGE